MKVHSETAILFALGLAVAVGPIVSARGADDLIPPAETAIEAVKDLFDISAVRPLERSSFEPLRHCFSAAQQRNIDAYLQTLERLTATRDALAARLEISDRWWWPSDIGMELRLITEGDPLTDRGAVPDKLKIGEPRLLRNQLRISAQEIYEETDAAGKDLGGRKDCEIVLTAEKQRWAIDEITFTVRQYGRVETRTLTATVRKGTKQLQQLRRRINTRAKPEVRRGMPVLP